MLLYRKGASTALEELERDVASWTLDFNKEANRMLVEREIFLEVKRTRDQLHGSELENTLERLSRRYKRFEDVGGNSSRGLTGLLVM